jgi:hypothetical protein
MVWQVIYFLRITKIKKNWGHIDSVRRKELAISYHCGVVAVLNFFTERESNRKYPKTV